MVTPLGQGYRPTVLWQDTASAPGQTWTGFRFITLPDNQMLRLRQWLDTPGGSYE